MYENEWLEDGALIVSGASGRVYKIIRTMSAVNYLCIAEDGTEWKIRRSGARRAPEGTVFNAPEKEQVEFYPGDTIRFTGKAGAKFPGTYVVLKVNPTGTAKYAKLNGRSWTTVSGSMNGIELVEVNA